MNLSLLPDPSLLIVESLQTAVADHDDGLEPLTLLLCVEHPDEEGPHLPVGDPLEVAVEEFVTVSQLQGLEPGTGRVVTASTEDYKMTVYQVSKLIKVTCWLRCRTSCWR